VSETVEANASRAERERDVFLVVIPGHRSRPQQVEPGESRTALIVSWQLIAKTEHEIQAKIFSVLDELKRKEEHSISDKPLRVSQIQLD
jgi:hypothetical protein